MGIRTLSVCRFSELEGMLRDFNFQQDQKWNRIRNNLKNIKVKLSPQVLAMTFGELEDLYGQGFKTYDDVQAHINKNPLGNITNTMLSASHNHMSAKAAKRTDDGKSRVTHSLAFILFCALISTNTKKVVLF